MVDNELSEKLRAKIPAHMKQLKQCFGNAWFSLQTLPELKDAFYVEGWVVFSNPDKTDFLVGEHGWLEFSDGRIVEITNLGQVEAYYPSYRYTRQESKKFKAVPRFNEFWGSDRINAHGSAQRQALERMQILLKQVGHEA